MTYYDIVNRVQQVVDDHQILQDFGYGALSDIKTVDEGTTVNYPYAFLNPTQSTRNQQSITYRFNLIVMDVVQEDPDQRWSGYLNVQSNCQQYVDDILARLRFYYQDQVDLTLNVALTPFKERFQDTLAGMTATLEFEVPNAINDCITPYRDLIHTGKLILGDRNYRNVGGQLAPELFNIWPVPEAPAVYTFEAEVRFSLNYDLTPLLAVGEVPQITFIQDADPTPRVIHVEEFQSSPELVGVPQTVNFKFTIDLEDAPPDDNRVFMFWGAESPGPQLANAVDALEGILKIYKP
jgi:hypothetical protein